MVPNIVTNSNPLLAGNPLMRTLPLPHHHDSDQQGPADRERETPWIRNLLPRQLPSSAAITLSFYNLLLVLSCWKLISTSQQISSSINFTHRSTPINTVSWGDTGLYKVLGFSYIVNVKTEDHQKKKILLTEEQRREWPPPHTMSVALSFSWGGRDKLPRRTAMLSFRRNGVLWWHWGPQISTKQDTMGKNQKQLPEP